MALTIPYDCYLHITIGGGNGTFHLMTAPWRHYLGTINGGGDVGEFRAGESVTFTTDGVDSTASASWNGVDTWTFTVPGRANWTVQAVPVATGIRNHVLDDGPLVYWQLEEQSGWIVSGSEDPQGDTAWDASGNAYHGTVYNAPASQSGPASCRGPYSRAPFLNGTGTGQASAQYIYRSSSPFSGTGDFTYEVWFWLPTDFFTFSHPYHTLMQQRLNPRADTGMLRVSIVTDPILSTSASIFLRAQGSQIITTDLSAIAGRAGCWCHVAVTRQAGLCTLYVNGTARGTASSSWSVTSNNLSVGGDQPDINPFLTQDEQELNYGRVAHFALFSHAVSASRISQRWGLGCNHCGSAGWQIHRTR